MKNNLINVWKRHFLIEEDALEIDSSILTSKRVLKASGHLANFNDYFVKDTVHGNMYRCDHLIEEKLHKLSLNKLDETEKMEINNILNNLKEMKPLELKDVIRKYKITSPTGGSLSEPGHFNLMFSTTINPETNEQIYFRPETAQGIFGNFASLAKLNQNRLPFAVGQVGTAFRNEINPQNKLLRTREFQMAELEYFYNPKCRSHEGFHKICDLEINMWPASFQMENIDSRSMSLKEAVSQNFITENHSYFLGRIYQFLISVGIAPDRFRFRQHLPNESAHYSSSCWDGECLVSLGWIECVGCADRGNYDLVRHSEESGVPLQISQILDEPKTIMQFIPRPVHQVIFKIHGGKQKLISNHLKNMPQVQLEKLRSSIQENGEGHAVIDNATYIITPDMIIFEQMEKTVSVEAIVPHVIEPSFGIGRILQCILEHNFYGRFDDCQRIVLTLPNNVAPYKVFLVPLMRKSMFETSLKTIVDILKRSNISYLVDYSNESIGRRYSRSDQIGIPYSITVDHESIDSMSATIRERNSMEQIRIQISDLPQILNVLISCELSWSEAVKQYQKNNC